MQVIRNQKKKRYIERKWLNPADSSSTGSIVVFDGLHSWDGKNFENQSWVEIKDCHSAVRLHRCYEDSLSDFIGKVQSMRDVLNRFLFHLKKEE